MAGREWVAVADERTGKRYFFCSDTGEVSWHAPAGATIVELDEISVPSEDTYDDSSGEDFDAIESDDASAWPSSDAEYSEGSHETSGYGSGGELWDSEVHRETSGATTTNEEMIDSADDDAVDGGAIDGAVDDGVRNAVLNAMQPSSETERNDGMPVSGSVGVDTSYHPMSGIPVSTSTSEVQESRDDNEGRGRVQRDHDNSARDRRSEKKRRKRKRSTEKSASRGHGAVLAVATSAPGTTSQDPWYSNWQNVLGGILLGTSVLVMARSEISYRRLRQSLGADASSTVILPSSEAEGSHIPATFGDNQTAVPIVDVANDGRFVYAHGLLMPSVPLRDPIMATAALFRAHCPINATFAEEIAAFQSASRGTFPQLCGGRGPLKIRRVVQMFAQREVSYVVTTNGVTTTHVDTKTCWEAHPTGAANPDMLFSSEEFSCEAMIGELAVDSHLLASLDDEYEPLPIGTLVFCEDDINCLVFEGSHDGWLYHGGRQKLRTLTMGMFAAKTPSLGDLRVRYEVVRADKYSIWGRQSGNNIKDEYTRTKAEGSAPPFAIARGYHPLEELLAGARRHELWGRAKGRLWNYTFQATGIYFLLSKENIGDGLIMNATGAHPVLTAAMLAIPVCSACIAAGLCDDGQYAKGGAVMAGGGLAMLFGVHFLSSR